jgi:mannose-6-phosphate isomerase-like protein (cupin superfamily)
MFMRLSKLERLPFEPVSHDPELKKKVLVKGVSCVEKLSHIVLVPGSRVSPHSHKKGYEVMCFVRGEALFKVKGTEVRLKKGDCLVVEPEEAHEIIEIIEETELLYFLAVKET